MLYKKDIKLLQDLKRDLTDLYLKYRDDLDKLEDQFNVENVEHYKLCKTLTTKNGRDCDCGNDMHYGNNEIGCLSQSIRNCIFECEEMG